jgi:hypothetical protein
MTLQNHENPVVATLDAVASHCGALSKRCRFDVPPTAAALAATRCRARKGASRHSPYCGANLSDYRWLAETQL